MNKRVTAEAIKEYVLNALGLKVVQYIDNITTSSNDYIKVRDIQLEQNAHNIIFVSSEWRSGKPLGLQIRNSWGIVASTEVETGFPSIAYSMTVGSTGGLIEIYQKAEQNTAPLQRVVTTVFTTKI